MQQGTDKISGRSRFVTFPWSDEENCENLFDALWSFKEKIQTKSKLQVTGADMKLFLDGESGKILRAGLQVIGVPTPEFNFLDQELSQFCEVDLELGPFEVSFDHLRQMAQVHYKNLMEKASQNGRKIQSEYQLLIYSHKIALHFFYQNDYIQTSE